MNKSTYITMCSMMRLDDLLYILKSLLWLFSQDDRLTGDWIYGWPVDFWSGQTISYCHCLLDSWFFFACHFEIRDERWFMRCPESKLTMDLIRIVLYFFFKWVYFLRLPKEKNLTMKSYRKYPIHIRSAEEGWIIRTKWEDSIGFHVCTSVTVEKNPEKEQYENLRFG